MNKKQLSLLIASLFVATPALAQEDPFVSTGSVTAGGIVTDVNKGNKDASKFEEYQDLGNGMLSNFGFTGRNSKSWIDAYGENFGRDDLYVNVRGGMYDVFKARAYTNWMPHNFLFNGLTPFSGSGSATLTATFPSANLANWQNLDLGYERKDTGGYFEWQRQSPWFFRVDGNQVKTQGTKVGAASNGTSPGSGYTDLALPVQYETNNVSFEAGYTTRAMTFTGSYMVSNFNNSNSSVIWNSPFWANGIDRTYLPPSNDYQRIALNGSIRDLPMRSTLSARYTWDKTESDLLITTFQLNGTGATAYAPTKPHEPEFNGEETRQTFTLGWSATPMTGLDTRVYYNWQKMKNDSTLVEFGNAPTDPSVSGLGCGTTAGLTPGTTVPGNCENELWDYKKNNFGADAYWRLDRSNRLGFGFDWYNIKQHRFDFDDTTTTTYWAEWKNTSMDNVSARLKYSYIHRSSDFLLGDAGVNANDPNYLLRYVKAFDLANFNQHRVKAVIDWAPADNVGVALEGIYKSNDYNKTVLGRTKDKRWEVFANVTYGMPSSARVTLFGDYESVKYDSDHRNIGAGSCPTAIPPAQGGGTAVDCFEPSTAPNPIAYNWSANVKNDNWMIGLGVDYPVNEQFMLTGSLLYDKVDGSSDMVSQNNYGNPLPLTVYPNVKTVSLNIKGTYRFDKNWSVTGGYAYQKYDYNDDQFDGYTNTIPFPAVTTNTSQSYLNGWNAYQTYNANIFYLLATFRY